MGAIARVNGLGLDDVPAHALENYNVYAELRVQPIFPAHQPPPAGNGLERWIIPALEHTQASEVMKRNDTETYRIIPELLESCGKLPVAEQWKRARREIQRDWAMLLREKPDIEVPAPWMLGQRKKRA